MTNEADGFVVLAELYVVLFRECTESMGSDTFVFSRSLSIL